MKMRVIAVLFLLGVFAFGAFSQSFDAAYDGRTYGYVSDVRNQAALGDCGVFASTAMLESSLLRQGIVTNTSFHISVYDTDYYAVKQYRGYSPNLTWINDTQGYGDWALGGWDIYSFGRRTGGYVSEGVTPFPSTITDWSKQPLTVPDPNAQRTGYMTHDIFYTSISLPVAASNTYATQIKSYVQNYGGAEIGYSIYATGSDAMAYFDSGNQNFRNTTTDLSAAHASLIVGWDDNHVVTINGVTSTGAWLVKNSWDTSFGNNGYFWMAYNSNIYFLESAVARGGYGKVYSHSQELNLGFSGTVGASEGVVGLGSIYALQRYATAGEEFLQAVSLSYTIDAVRSGASTDLASYELKIYSTKIGDNLSDLLYSQTGNIHDGITTIDLTTVVQINGNFYILIKVIPSSSGGFGLYTNGGVEGNGWFSMDGVMYYDLATAYSDPYTWDIDAIMAAIPEPSTCLLLLGGMICLCFVVVRRRKAFPVS